MTTRSGKTEGPSLPDGAKETRSFTDLTPRQREVALLLAEGKFNAEIANEIGCSLKTVDTHRAHILGRLGLRNNVELVRFLIATDVIDVVRG